MPSDLFWSSTPVEVGALVDAFVVFERRRDRAADHRAGVIAATIMNTRLVIGEGDKKVWEPSDFFRYSDDPPKSVLLPPQALAGGMESFAAMHNASLKRKRGGR